MSEIPRIIYTHTDEAPALATQSFLPILQAFAASAKIDVETRDISLAGRILAVFPDFLEEDQRVSDDLAELGEMVTQPGANIIKLPCISASVPQLTDAIAELQEQGFDLPDYPEEPETEEEEAIKARYDRVKGSAVNPVLREGNSDRRVPKAVKQYARQNPPPMGEWSSDSQAHVATMSEGDFRHTEESITVPEATSVRVEHVDDDGSVTVLKEELSLLEGEVIDAAVMSREALVSFLRDEVDDARENDILFSLHMKATMMKVSDPIIFGYAVEAYYEELFDEFGDLFDELGVDVRNGFGDVERRLEELSDEKRKRVEKAVQAIYDEGPGVAMVNSDKGITNLHVPSDFIIDASMPVMIRDSGQLWNADGEQQTAKAVIPDSSYAPIYQELIEFCKEHGALDPTTIGSIPNVGLMAKKAEEYGSHDKTFEIASSGTVRVVDADGSTLLSHDVGAGDIWRMCQTKDAPIRDWVKLAINRARATGAPAVFWLDEDRAHDARLIEKVNRYLDDHDLSGIETHIKAPVEAMRFSLQRMKEGEDTISVTGNVLRDYLTDLFPILEVGTSARVLSIVPLMNGGGLFETGAGGSAPKHVQQFREVNYLRWDSLGEFMALTASLEHLAESFDKKRAQILSDALDEATTKYLLNNKSPAREVGKIDNRGSHFYLTLYWARALAEQDEDQELAERFADVAEALESNKDKINEELIAVQRQPVEMGGYYHPDPEVIADKMRPSATLNAIIDEI